MLKKIFWFFFSLFLASFDGLLNLKFRFDEREHSPLLIVRVDNIGDFILWLPFVKNLHARYSFNKKPILICNRTCFELAQATGLFSKVIGVNNLRFTRDLKYRYRMLRNIASLGASVAIQPTYSRVFLIGDSLVRASNAKERIGFDCDLSNISPWQKRISDRWYTQLVPASLSPMMELNRNAEFLRNLGKSDVYASLPVLPELVKLATDKTISEDYFIMFPGASSPIKIWPVESFARVARKIVDEYGFVPVICGGEMEQELGDLLLRRIGDDRGKNYAGETSIPELSEMVRGARFVVSNDTSVVHIATAVATPSVCILGGGHYGRFLPYPVELEGVKPITVINKMNCFCCNWRCQFTDDQSRPYPCVEGISIQQVKCAVDLVMRQTPTQ